MSKGDSATPLGKVRGLGSAHHGGTHWLAERWSSTYAPVRRSAMKLCAISIWRVLAQTSGSLRRSHASFGPIAWLESSVPPRARIASAPNRAVCSSISRVARVSMPYRMAISPTTMGILKMSSR